MLLLAGVLVAAVGLDRWRHADEVDRVVAAARSGEVAVEASRARIAGLVEYQSALLFRDDVRPALRASLMLGLSREAARSLPRLRAMRREVAAIDVLPWHRDTRAAKRAYVDRLDVWVAHLEAGAENAEDLFRRHPEITAARRAAAAALRVVSRDRADALFR